MNGGHREPAALGDFSDGQLRAQFLRHRFTLTSSIVEDVPLRTRNCNRESTLMNGGESSFALYGRFVLLCGRRLAALGRHAGHRHHRAVRRPRSRRNRLHQLDDFTIRSRRDHRRHRGGDAVLEIRHQASFRWRHSRLRRRLCHRGARPEHGRTGGRPLRPGHGRRHVAVALLRGGRNMVRAAAVGPLIQHRRGDLGRRLTHRTPDRRGIHGSSHLARRVLGIRSPGAAADRSRDGRCFLCPRARRSARRSGRCCLCWSCRRQPSSLRKPAR